LSSENFTLESRGLRSNYKGDRCFSPPLKSYNLDNALARLASMTDRELENQLLKLSALEKAEIIQRLTKTISGGAKGLLKRLVCVVAKHVLLEPAKAVWLLVEARRLGISEAQLLDDYPHITE
jgi:hypothetical protein